MLISTSCLFTAYNLHSTRSNTGRGERGELEVGDLEVWRGWRDGLELVVLEKGGGVG